MKLSIIVIGLIVCITGCANTSELQAKLAKSEAHAKDLNDRLELAEGSIQEIRAEASKDNETCMKAMQKLHALEAAASSMYEEQKPVVIRMATDAYDAARPVVVQAAGDALNWGADQIKSHLPTPNPSVKPSK